jgi:hypothetical protein
LPSPSNGRSDTQHTIDLNLALLKELKDELRIFEIQMKHLGAFTYRCANLGRHST